MAWVTRRVTTRSLVPIPAAIGEPTSLAHTPLLHVVDAVHLGARVERFVPLVDLGVVLHRCRHSESGAVVLHAAVDHHDQSPEAHYALGNAYAVLGDYNRSATCFNNTVKLEPGHEGARKRRHAVLCHDRLETALETQHKYGEDGVVGRLENTGVPPCLLFRFVVHIR